MDIQEFSRRFRRAPEELRREKESVLQRVVIRIWEAVQVEEPVRTGALRRKTVHEVQRTGERGAIRVQAWYGRIIHDGAKPHIIRARKGKMALRLPDGSFRRRVFHPGVQSNPFLTRALKNSQNDVARILHEGGEKLWARVVLSR